MLARVAQVGGARPVIVDIANNPRITAALGRIEELRRAAQERPDKDPERLRMESEAAALYVEIGHYVHWMLRQDPGSLTKIEEEAKRAADQLGRLPLPPAPEVESSLFIDPEPVLDELEPGTLRVLSAEISGAIEAIPASEASGSLRAVRRSPLGAWDNAPFQPLPEVDPIEALGAVDSEVEPPTAPTSPTNTEVSSVAGDEDVDDALNDPAPYVSAPVRARIQPRGGSLAAVEDQITADDAGDWLAGLLDVLDGLGPPESLDRAPDFIDAITAVTRATTSLEMRWAEFPDAVQQALLGFVGARARRLQDVVPGDADIRIALGRMERYAHVRGLMIVPSLRRSAIPKDWRQEEKRYWAVLRAGAV